MFAALGDDSYNLVQLIHVLAAFVFIAPAIVHPLVSAANDDDPTVMAKVVTGLPQRVYLIAGVLVGIIGSGLVSMSDDAWQWGDTWVWLSFIVWIAMLGVQHGALIPAERRWIDGDGGAAQTVRITSAVFIALGAFIAYLMVFKPGSGIGF